MQGVGEPPGYLWTTLFQMCVCERICVCMCVCVRMYVQGAYFKCIHVNPILSSICSFFISNLLCFTKGLMQL